MIRSNSSCSKAIDLELYGNRRKNPRPVNSIIAHERDIKLKYINIGAGTTGSRTIHRLFCEELGVISLHYSDSCNSAARERNKLLTWYNHVTKCAANSKNNCACIDVLKSVTDRILSISRTFEFVSDTPVDMLFQEFHAIAPHVSRRVESALS
jgi:hypothetical protein